MVDLSNNTGGIILKGYVLTIILLLILFSSSVYGEADSKVEVIEISGSVLFKLEEAKQVVLKIQHGDGRI